MFPSARTRAARGGAAALALGVVVIGALLLPRYAAASGATPPAHTTFRTAASDSPRVSPAAATQEPTSLHLVVGTASDPATGGYWLVASNGGVFAFGAPFYGSAGALHLVAPIVGMAATTDGRGYWLVASDGGIFAYGDAGFSGSMGGRPLNRAIVGMAAASGGYWLTAADGGVFAFGATFYGSMGGRPLNQAIVGMASTPDRRGYWFTASDGGVFAFGDARFRGSTGDMTLNSPVVAMLVDPVQPGYWLVAADGGVFAFGAPFYGSAAGHLNRAATAIGGATGTGYRIISADGSVYAYGKAAYEGGVYVPPLVGQTVAIDPGHDGGNGNDPGFINQPIDGGGFSESCDTVGTETAAGYTEHAFNFDVGTRLQSLLVSQGATVVMTRTNDSGIGPCVNTRAGIANVAGATVAISIHGDGGPVPGRGFDVIEPAPVISAISNNTSIVLPSALLAQYVRNAFGVSTGEPASDYAGSGGIDQRNDLGGLNLSTVPKVLIECANMQNPADAALTENPQWRQQAAQGLAEGITGYVETSEIP
jgi:N-acetylmuramoyl-L-alanine amidase